MTAGKRDGRAGGRRSPARALAQQASRSLRAAVLETRCSLKGTRSKVRVLRDAHAHMSPVPLEFYAVGDALPDALGNVLLALPELPDAVERSCPLAEIGCVDLGLGDDLADTLAAGAGSRQHGVAEREERSIGGFVVGGRD